MNSLNIQSDVPFQSYIWKFNILTFIQLRKRTNTALASYILGYLPDPDYEHNYERMIEEMKAYQSIVVYMFDEEDRILWRRMSRRNLVTWLMELSHMDETGTFFNIATEIEMFRGKMFVYHPDFIQLDGESWYF